jgi:thymidylate synthase
MWNQNEPANLLYERYNHAWPRIKRAKGNWRGVYFQRLINYNDSAPLVNQLQYIISLWHDQIHRHSALQAGVFDPNRDHKKTRQLGFPCLHQVAFSPLGTNGVGGLSVTGFYATQTMLEKAYGNYLGLTRLGQFMAKEMGLTLVEVTCIAALENVSGKFSKGELKDLAEQLQAQTGATTEPEGDPK